MCAFGVTKGVHLCVSGALENSPTMMKDDNESDLTGGKIQLQPRSVDLKPTAKLSIKSRRTHYTTL